MTDEFRKKGGKEPPDKELLKIFAANLKSCIPTNEWLAVQTGLSAQAIADYVNGVSLPRADYLFKISIAIGKSVDWLLSNNIAENIKEAEDKMTINTLIELVKEQGKRIDEQKNLISAQGDRITDQGKRIDLVANIAKKAQDDTDFLRDRVASIQDAINNNYSELKGKMKKAADTGNLKALGE